jgi:hypothetical protein
VALFPGGFGTLDEAMETLTLVQTGKRAPMPIVLMDTPGGTYWSSWVEFLKKELGARQYIASSDFNFFEQADSVDQAVLAIGRFYTRYHSLRYTGDKLVIRLLSFVEDQGLAYLRRHFQDVLLPGGDFASSGALPVEDDEPELAHLPRLIVDFNRKDFARLRSLIDALNLL